MSCLSDLNSPLHIYNDKIKLKCEIANRNLSLKCFLLTL